MTRASTALAGSAPAGLVLRATDLPADVDPLTLLHGMPDLRRFYWEHPAQGVAIAAVGAAATVTGSGPARFARVAAALADLRREAPGAVAVGGFAFAPGGGGGAMWRGFPAAEWTVPRVAVIRRGGRARLIVVAGADDASATLDDLAARARAALRARLPAPPPRAATYRATGAAPALWQRAVATTLDDIAAGRLDKLVLARPCSVRASFPFDPVHVAARLRDGFPECAVFAVAHGGATFVGASPERLVRVAGRRLDTAAVAGSAPRGTSPRTDRARARALLADPKERAEHALVVNDVRARLAPLCDTVAAPAEPRVLATQAVQHLHTPIRARLRPGAGILDAVAALHPTPAVCGTPRDVAHRLLAAREGIARGWYSGGVGWIGADGGEVTVALRTALLRGTQALLHAGAGIVAGSTWDAELEETRLKLRPLLSALLEL